MKVGHSECRFFAGAGMQTEPGDYQTAARATHNSQLTTHEGTLKLIKPGKPNIGPHQFATDALKISLIMR